jgi:hypothetical protein
MEGVVVSAKRADSNITISVISNAQGRFTIPADRLPPGQYTITTRAVGYDLDGPKQATIAAGGPTSVDVKLRKTRNLSHQLTNAEWMLSMPGNDEDKLAMINCVSCHTHERIMKSSHNAEDFVGVIQRMNGYAQVSNPAQAAAARDRSRASNPERFKQANSSPPSISKSDTWATTSRPLPRVKGAA